MVLPKADFKEELEALLNKYSIDADCNTPDFILAELVVSWIDAYHKAINDTAHWRHTE